jgi:hypothetical protein
MQAAGELVVLIGEFPARVQPSEDQFHARNLLFRVDVDRHAAAVVFYFERTILVNGHLDVLAVAADRFIDAIVDHLVREMIWSAGVGVHPRPATHGVEAAQDLDIGGGVRMGHRALHHLGR